ncbi:MAG TPA: YchJ family metal-binding protein [Candidimonas sp.]|nr:YchJ family metal-binding protein [Candidimonas sp.]
MNRPNVCPCGGMPDSARYADCCQPYIDGLASAPSAEHLMRSRYTAYALGRADYVLSTWAPQTRPTSLSIDPPGTPHAVRWLGLAVHSHTRLTPTQAQVLFTARYRESGKGYRLKEHSRFVLIDDKWYYLDGDVDFAA